MNASRHQTSSAVTLWYLVLLSNVWVVLTSCACGYTSWVTTIVVLPIFCFACYLFFKSARPSKLEQIFAAIAFPLLLAILVKNVIDIIRGHP